jgi:hypothetical protein
MALPSITQTWQFNPNVRSTFASLNDTMATLLFQTKNFLVATLAWTVKYTCDGTTGPTNASDHTDRWASKANCTTRFSGTGGAQSFAVLTNADGADILLSYNGASDDIATLRYSPGGLYAPAGTANQEPTATDEVIVTTGTTLINSTASLDRVFWFLGTTDKRMFRVAVMRNGTLISYWGVEKITSALVAPATWSLTAGGTSAMYGFYHSSGSLTATGAPTSILSGTQGAASYLGGSARVHTSSDLTIALDGGGESRGLSAAVSGYAVEKPELQGSSGELMYPLQKYSNTASASGKVGTCIDWWYAVTNAVTTTPALGDTFGTLQYVCLGPTTIWPWDGTTTPVMT